MSIWRGGGLEIDQSSKLDGVKCWEIRNQLVSVWLSADFGPRVLGLSYEGSENLLAHLPEAKIEGFGRETYWLRGGHRLWYGPERPETTYIPDDRPPQVKEIHGGLEFIQQIDQPSGIQKSWQIRLAPEAPRVEIDHCLTNCGDKAYELAPWAITMLPPGGIGLLPFQEEEVDEHGLWPNRQLVFWPYTDVCSSHLKITNQGVFVTADLKEGALKIGAPNPLGWIAYRHNHLVFIKQSLYQKGAKYLDQGASHQIYCNPDMIELESLGTLVQLSPGESSDHKEIWSVYPEGACPEEVQGLYALIDPLNPCG